VEEAFDAEQIWEQLDLAAGSTLRRVRKLVAAAMPLAAAGQHASIIKPQHQAAIDELAGDVAPTPSSDEDDSGDEDHAMRSEDADGDADIMDLDDEDGFEEEMGEEEEEGEGGRLQRDSKRARRQDRQLDWEDDGRGLHPTEDRFLRLKQMESFLRDSERIAARLLEAGDDEDQGEGDEGGDGGDDIAERE
jgi:hypothetical protein